MKNGKSEGAKKVAAWTVVARVVAQAAQFATFLVAARELGPADFGMFAMVSAAHVLAVKMASAGWHEFMIGWTGDDETRENAFTLSVLAGCAMGGLGIGIGLLCYLAGLAQAYRALIVLLGAATLSVGATASWAGDLYRKGCVSSVTRVHIVGEILGTGVALGGLYLGLGLVALGFWKFALQTFLLFGLGGVSRWFPRMRINSSGRNAIFKHIKSLLSSELIVYVQGYSATLLLGLFLGAGPVGTYRAAVRLVGSLGEVVGETINSVSWTVLGRAKRATELASAAAPSSAAQADHGLLVRAAQQLLTAILLVTAPLFVGLAVVSESVVLLLLGPEWREAATLVSILAIARLSLMPSTLVTPLLTLTSQVRYMPRLRLSTGGAVVLAVVCCGPFGATATAMGQIVAAVVGTALSLRIYELKAGLQWFDSLASSVPSLLAALVMTAAVFGMQALQVNPQLDIWLRCGFEIGVGALAYLLAFMLFGGKKVLLTSTRFS